MQFALSKELEMLRKAVREFAEKKIAPNADEWDANHHLPIKEAIKPMGELGFFGTVIPCEPIRIIRQCEVVEMCGILIL